MRAIPFLPSDELYSKLYIGSKNQGNVLQRRGNNNQKEKNYLPSRPQFLLHDVELGSYLHQELVPRDLNKLAKWLWLVAKQDHTHVAALTAQKVRGRQIIITEDPELHLVWINDRIFIKPIPRYLLSHSFWEFFLASPHSPISNPRRDDIARAARGFLRSYSYLIVHQSDYSLGRWDNLGLLPKGVKYSDFIQFISHFQSIENDDVCPRFEFGDLRLSRLNLWSKVFLRRMWFFRVHRQYGEYFAQFYGPLLFVFGIFSVVLSAFQVALAVPIASSPGWTDFPRASWGFAIFTLVSVVATLFFLVALFLVQGLRETIFALQDLRRKDGAGSAKEKCSVEAAV